MTNADKHSRLQAAAAMAMDLHADQVRKGTTVSYVSHLFAVASLVMEAGGDEDEVIAALLHDAAEDRGGEATLADIRARFGDRVAGIVEECSDTFADPKPPWRERKERYIDTLAEVSRSALLVSAADKLHNARAILDDYREHGESLWERFRGGRDGTLWYYRELLNRYVHLAAPWRIVGELERVVETLEDLVRARL